MLLKLWGAGARPAIRSDTSRRSSYARNDVAKRSSEIPRGDSVDIRRLSLHHDTAGSKQHLDLTLGPLPPVEAHLKSGYLGKLCQEEWQPRFLVVTTEHLVIALPGNNSIADRIPLVIRRQHNQWSDQY